MRLEELEKSIGYTFKNKLLLKTALTHTSYAYEKKQESNERLEFLGDSILEFISTKILYNQYKKLTEGEMTKVRAFSVCEDSLYKIAIEHNFSDFLFLGKSERTSKGPKKAILADSVEAVIAAIYLDSNIENAEKFIINNIKDSIEYASRNVGTKEQGPDHDKTFYAQVSCNGKILETGSGHSKKLAEMDAARKALEKI